MKVLLFRSNNIFASGFINLKLSGTFLANYLEQMRTSDAFGVEKIGAGKKVVIDYGGPNVAKAVQDAKAGKIEYRLDKTNIIHCPIGKASFGKEKLVENFDALMGAIIKAKPAAAKGQYIKSCVVASTMGPGVKVNAAKLG